MDNHIERPEVIAAQEFGEGFATRYSNTLQTEFIYYANKFFRFIHYIFLL